MGLAKITKDGSPRRHDEISPVKVKDTHPIMQLSPIFQIYVTLTHITVYLGTLIRISANHIKLDVTNKKHNTVDAYFSHQKCWKLKK